MARYVLFLLSIIHLGLGDCTAMRIVPFREVLHGVAYKMGLDPEQSNFLDNQAIPIGTYINEWVRRTYDAKDWPEWVVTKKFQPNNHVVTWDAINSGSAGNITLQIGRVLDVFLIDPATTDAPVDTAFSLQEDGVHVGYEHGTYVWIRFMPLPPQYTAVSWRPDTIFAKNDVTYSYTTGQVYKSKSNGNLGHDPATNWGRPPIHEVLEPEPPSPAPVVETTQVRIDDSVGIASRNEILVLSMADAFTGTTPADPPENGTDFIVEIVDVASETTIADTLVTADGVMTLNDVIDAIVAALSADPDLSTYTITANHTNKTITFENASLFTTGHSEYAIPSEGGVNHPMKSVVTQTYIPPLAAASGQPQITRVSMTDDSTVPGSTYSLNVTDSGGTLHTVTYASQLYDSAAQILQGLLLAAEAAQVTDTFWTTVQFTFDPSNVTLDLSVRDTFSVDAPAPPPGSAWWELVPFPKALADQVMTGALSDLLGEWGQQDKQALIQQGVGQEVGVAEGKFNTMPTPELSGQQAPLSRYRIQ